MLKGSCLCGEIKYEIEGDLGAAMYCHCQKCRKANGSAFAVNALVQAKNFHFVKGEQWLSSFQSSPDAKRFFCSHCGSPIYSQREAMPDVLRLRVGTLDDEIVLDKQCHIFVGSKANWDEIHDDLPQYDERPTH